MYLLPPGNYCFYLRKSRVDIEAEARGEEDTYARHEKVLLDLAARLGVSLTEVYREKPATSGERISERPEMLRLLGDVEEGKWDGVFVIEVERLARGDTMDQGIVAQAFKYSETLIITPMRIYNPNDPNDEEYFEFGLFMSRREFKTITRRLQGGRVRSVEDGKYVGNKPPYGYIRKKLPGKGYTLEPDPEQAPIVQLIFSLYTDTDPEKRMGTGRIARYLNEELKVPTANASKTGWIVATINSLLRNPIYIGRVRWSSRPQIKKKNSKSRPRKNREDWLEVQGLHEPIIDEITFNRAQKIMEENSHPPAPKGKISNPLAGLIRCDMCGGAIVLKPDKKTHPYLLCQSSTCKNVSSYLHLVEERLLQSLNELLFNIKREINNIPDPHENDQADLRIKLLQDQLKTLLKKKDELTIQKNNLHDLVERGIYSTEDYLERSKVLTQRLDEINDSILKSNKEIQHEERRSRSRSELAPIIEKVLQEYTAAASAAEKNALLRSILSQVTYRKIKGGRWSGEQSNFEIKIYPKFSFH
ncbi:recombinase family protein [Paenibacillus sp. S-38]|uniref:recombinase family protein n=1 Tax=Paenibacillus sp. S-38 TaxID=3416710 RepID=UPI003CF466EF